MSLQENTSYQSKFKPFLQGMANTAMKIGQSLPSKKSVNLQPLQGITNAVKSGVSSAKSKLGSITTPYGGSTKYEKFHPGVDIANNIGTGISAFAPGKVTKVVTGQKQGSPGYGNYVEVTDPTGLKHRYSHLAGEYVQVGQSVNKGQQIGSMGNTGQTYSLSGGTGSHLDYRIVDMYGKYVNPYKFISS